MTDFERQRRFSVEAVDETRTGSVAKLIGKSLNNPQRRAQITDPIELNLLEAALPEFGHNGQVVEYFNEAFAQKRMMEKFFPTSYALRMFELAVDAQLKVIFGGDYTKNAHLPAFWADQDIFDQLDYDQFLGDMVYQNQAYNNPITYRYFDLQLNKFQYLWDRPAVVVDVGGSSGKGAQVIMMRDKYPSRPITTYQSFEPDNNGSLPPDLEAQERLDELRSQHATRGGAVSLDILTTLSDEGAEPWVFANTFPMSEEMRDPEAVQQFKALDNEPRYSDKLRASSEDPQGVGTENQPNVCVYSFSVDVRDPNSLEILGDILPGGTADFFIISGVLMQLTQEDTVAALQNLSPYSSKNALISASDWSYLDTRKLSGMNVRRRVNYWQQRAGFTNFLINPHDLNQAPIPTATFLNRKCGEAVLTEQGRQIMLG